MERRRIAMPEYDRLIVVMLAFAQKAGLALLSASGGFPGIVFLTVLFLGILPVYCASLDLRLAGEPLPNQIRLAWNPVENAVWYDFYEGPAGSENFLVRLEASQLRSAPDGYLSWISGGNEQPLYAETSYRIVAAARNADGRTLASAVLDTTTAGWGGTYQWRNPTDDDNDGRVRDITLVAKRGPDIPGIPVYYEIYGNFLSSGVKELQKVFPLFPLDSSSFDWVSYKDGSKEATAYRLNAEKFNKTNMKPKSWKVQSIQVGAGQYVTKILTKALGFEVATVSTYTFRLDENDNREICFLNQGSGMASIGLFANPEESGAPFVLSEM